MKSRKVHSLKSESKVKSSNPSHKNGFGYIIIPNDVPRDKYIRDVYLTGYVMIITDYNEPVRDVLVSVDVIQSLVFPTLAGEYGSLVRYSTHGEVPCIESIHFKQDESHMYRENTYADVEEHGGKTMGIVRALNGSNFLISYDDKGDNAGSITISAKGSKEGSTVVLGLDGNISIKSSDGHSVTVKKGISVKATTSTHELSESIEVKVKIDDETENTLKIDKEKLSYVDQFNNELTIEDGLVKVVSEKIDIGGDATEKAVLGTSLVTELTKMNVAIQAIVTGIKAGAVLPTDGGATYKASLTAAVSAVQASDFSQVLSGKVVLK